MSGMRSRIGAGSLWITGSRALVNLLATISTIVLARLLVPADFGLVATGTAIFAVVQAITDISMTQALINHDSPTRAHMDTAWTLGVLRALLIGGLLAASGPFLSTFFEDARMTQVMYAFGFSMFLSGFANPRRIMLQKELVFWQDFVMNVSAKLVSVIVSVAIAFLDRSYWALLLGTIAGQVATVLISYSVLPFLPRPSFRHSRDLLGFSVWLTLSQVVNNLNWRLDALLIGKFLGASALGLYTVGNNLATLPTRESTQPLTRTLFPAFSKIRDNPERLKAGYQRAQTLMTSIALPLGVGVALVANLLIPLLLGEKWMPALIVIQVISVVAAVQTLSTLAQSVAMATGDTRLIFVRSTQMLLVRVPFILLGMYLDGLRGLILARALTGSFGIFANCFIVRRLIGLGVFEQLVANARTFASVAVMAVAVLAVKVAMPHSASHLALAAEVIVSAAVGVLVYLGTLFALWRAAGRPVGPEREMLVIATTGFSKLAHAVARRRGRIA